MATGKIIYEGASLIDGKPIVCIAVGLDGKSTNSKTGGMVQTYILLKDQDPVSVVKSGLDESICGDCKHRPSLASKNGEARCYVNVGQGALAVYKSYKKGNYSRDWSEDDFIGKSVRLGTYGDPAAVPYDVLSRVVLKSKKHTGYTHQWMSPTFDRRWFNLCMASVDNAIEKFAAKMMGARTFEVTTGVRKTIKSEVTCPASSEGGRKTTCERCLLCGGNSVNAKDVVIADHGLGWKSRLAKSKTQTI